MMVYDKGATITDQCAHRIMAAIPDPDWRGCTAKEEYLITYHEEGLYSVHDREGTICVLIFARNPNEAIEKLKRGNRKVEENSMIDFSLRECPFCGNPAEIVNTEPYSWNPNGKVKAIRCSNPWCHGNTIDLKFMVDSKSSEIRAKDDWNTRKRKNKLAWRNRNE